MAGQSLGKVLDLVSSFEATCKETRKGCYDSSKKYVSHAEEYRWATGPRGYSKHRKREHILSSDVHPVNFLALEVFEWSQSYLHGGTRPEVITLKPIVDITKCHDPIAKKCTDESFNGLFWAQTD